MDVNVYAKGRMGYNAKGIYDGKGLTIKKGSILSHAVASKVNPIVTKLRNDRETVSEDYILLKDVSFRSASTAATFVTGNISNGMRVWKVEPGKDLGTYTKEVKHGRI